MDVWSKTILHSYKYLNRVCNSIDKLVEKESLNTSVMSGLYLESNNSFNVANRIIDLTERKIELINLKLLSDKILKNLDSKLSIILVYKYIDNYNIEEIYKKLNISRRTYFRRIKSAIVSFGLILKKYGYDDVKLNKMLNHQKWIKDVYIKYKNEEIDNIDNVITFKPIKSYKLFDKISLFS